MKLTTLILLSFLTFTCKQQDTKSKENFETKADSLTTIRQEEKKNNCNTSVEDKVFEYLPDNDVPEHLFTIVFNCDEHGLTGKIFGPDPEGEHGLFFFKANLDNLRVDDLNKIEFEFVKGLLYSDQITIDDYLDTLTTDDAGISKGKIFYSGQIAGDSIIFSCTSEYDDCYDETMTFRVKK